MGKFKKFFKKKYRQAKSAKKKYYSEKAEYQRSQRDDYARKANVQEFKAKYETAAAAARKAQQQHRPKRSSAIGFFGSEPTATVSERPRRKTVPKSRYVVVKGKAYKIKSKSRTKSRTRYISNPKKKKPNVFGGDPFRSAFDF